MKKKIVFIPTYDYSSNPLFLSIVPLIKGFHTIYFNTKEIISWSKCIEEEKKEEILKQFDEYRSIDYTRTRNKLVKIIAVFRYRKKIHGILTEIKPAAVITTSDMSFSSKLAKVWTRKNDVPLIILQPSFFDSGTFTDITSLTYRLKYLVFNRLFSIPLAPLQKQWGNEYSDNHLLLWGKHFKNIFKGLPIYENIYLTGNPVYDKYFSKSEDIDLLQKEIYDEYNLPSYKKVITICTEGMKGVEYRDAPQRLNKIYREIIERRQELFFIIKLHPRDSLEEYKRTFCNLQKNNFIIVKDMELRKLYLISSAQISVCSASSFEAVVAGVPIILINPDYSIEFDDFFQKKIEVRASNVDELDSCISLVLTKEYCQDFKIRREKYLKEMMDNLDGKAGQRVSNTIVQILNKRKVS